MHQLTDKMTGMLVATLAWETNDPGNTTTHNF